MARRSGLGRGLGALIPNDRRRRRAGVRAAGAAGQRGRPQPAPASRATSTRRRLGALTASVRELGVLQPVLVRDTGERPLRADRRRAALAGREAGRACTTIPAVVRPSSDDASLEQALVENLHREDLNPLEEAAAYQQLIEDFGLTQEDVARRVGKSRSAIANTLRLFQLPPAIQRMVADGQLSAGHARALLGTPDRAFQEALARRAVEGQLSVREVEEAVRARSRRRTRRPTQEPAARPRRRAGPGPPGCSSSRSCCRTASTPGSRSTMGAKRVEVVIDFAALEDLERIYRCHRSERRAGRPARRSRPNPRLTSRPQGVEKAVVNPDPHGGLGHWIRGSATDQPSSRARREPRVGHGRRRRRGRRPARPTRSPRARARRGRRVLDDVGGPSSHTTGRHPGLPQDREPHRWLRPDGARRAAVAAEHVGQPLGQPAPARGLESGRP